MLHGIHVGGDQAEFLQGHKQEGDINGKASEALLSHIASLLKSRCASRGESQSF